MVAYCVCLLVLLLLVNYSLGTDNSVSTTGSNNSGNRKKKRARCAHLWRPDNLPGKCFGLRPYNEYDELRDIKKVQSPNECKGLCCLLGEQCVTWQYQNVTGSLINVKSSINTAPSLFAFTI